jgi:SAM-dependent methyltransferase
VVEGAGLLRYVGTGARPGRRPWNHNTHYHRLVLARLPAQSHWALDVGCGEGALAGELAAVVPHVVGLDVHAPSLAVARAATPGVHWVRGDITAHPLRPGTFDLVTGVASLHHVDAATSLRAMAALLRPGGRLVLVALARSRLPRDLGWELAAVVAHRAYRLTRRLEEHGAPTVWPPPYRYGELRAIARETLPGVRFRRRLLWRASLDWTKPLSGS